MTTIPKTAITPGELYRVTAEVFAAMLGLAVERSHTGGRAPLDGHTATATLTGPLQAGVCIDCSTRQATEFASLLAGRKDKTLGDAEIQGALQELVHRIADSLKALLPAGTVLSDSPRSPALSLVVEEQITLISPWGPFVVEWFEPRPHP